MRCFIALPIDTKTRHQLSDLATECQGLPWSKQLKWFCPDNYHLTLQFIGSKLEPVKVQQIIESMHDWLGNDSHAFNLDIDAVCLFPNQIQAHTLIAKVENSPALQALVEQIGTQLSGMGLQRAQQPFWPHISLGRIIKQSDISAIQIPKTMQNLPNLKLRVDTITLYQSQLTGKSPIYTELKSIYLKK